MIETSLRQNIESLVNKLTAFSDKVENHLPQIEIPNTEIVSHGDTQIRQGRTELEDIVRSLRKSIAAMYKLATSTVSHLTCSLQHAPSRLLESAYDAGLSAYDALITMFETANTYERSGKRFTRIMSDNVVKTIKLSDTNDALIKANRELETKRQEIQKKNDEFYNLLTKDQLTGTYNEFYFKRELGKEIKEANAKNVPLTLIYFDLDGFKKVNDDNDHDAGDDVLKEVVERCLKRKQDRETDVFARLHGDEFAVLLSRTTEEQGATLAVNLLGSLVAKPFFIDNQPYAISGSFGVVPYVAGHDAKFFVKRADKCMYYAKSIGKKTVATESMLKNQIQSDNGPALITRLKLKKMKDYYLQGVNPPKV